MEETGNKLNTTWRTKNSDGVRSDWGNRKESTIVDQKREIFRHRESLVQRL